MRSGVAFINYRKAEDANRAREALHGTRIRQGYKMHITPQVHRAVREAHALSTQLQ